MTNGAGCYTIRIDTKLVRSGKLKLSPIIIVDIIVFAISISACIYYSVPLSDWFVTKESFIFLGYSLSTFIFGIIVINKIKKEIDTIV